MIQLQDLDLSDPTIYGALFGSGVLIHLAAFRVGEWDLWTPRLISGTAILHAAATYGLSHLAGDASLPILEAAKTAGLLVGSLVGGVYSSILMYRAFFHRLNRFPGPFMARLSNFYVTGLSVKNFHLFEETQKLHAKYGDIVRLGPSELSIIDPRAHDLIHSNRSPCEKGPWYNVLYPHVSLQMIRDRKVHAQRRKAWDKGLGSQALRDYEPRIEKYTKQLLREIEKNEGKPLNVTRWFHFYSFDVMGDMAFSKSFNMLKEGIVHWYMKLVHKNMLAVGIFSHLIWIFPVVKAIPIVNGEHLKTQAWIKDQVDTRWANKPKTPDLFSWIIADYESRKNPTKQDLINVQSDANLIIVAGSDTTAATLTSLFFALTHAPDALQKLRSEIDQYWSENEEASAASMAKLNFLNACINETLRLYPPVPGGVQRMTPPEGLQLGETFIPGNTIVQIPTWTVQRDERNFVQPNDFIPDRWTTKPELVKDASNFHPFGVGRYGCAGKQLGLMEVRSVTTQILRDYNIRLANSMTPKQYMDGSQDTFTMTMAEVEMVFEKRTKA